MRYALRIVVALLLGAPLGAQPVASRVNAVSNGAVRMTFDILPDVCGWGNGWSRGDNNWRGRNDYGRSTSRDVEWSNECMAGPGRLVVDRSSGETMKVRFYVGGRWRERPNVTDLGQ